MIHLLFASQCGFQTVSVSNNFQTAVRPHEGNSAEQCDPEKEGAPEVLAIMQAGGFRDGRLPPL